MAKDAPAPRREGVANRHIPQLSWLVIPEQTGNFKSLTAEKLKTLLQHATKYQVGAVYFHGLNMCDFVFMSEYDRYVSLIVNNDRRAQIAENIAHLNTLASMVRRAGMKTILSCSVVSLPHGFLAGCHNFVNPFVSCYPELLDADGEFFWRMLDNQVTELFRNVPASDGLDVYLFEGNFQLTSLNGRSSHADRISRLFSVLAEACSRSSKSFSIMCFAHTRYEDEEVRTAISRLSPNDNLTVRHFANSCDYHPYMPSNENIGRVGNHFESLEFDCVGEYWGQGRIPCCYPQYIKERLAGALQSSPRVREVVCRVNWEWGYIFDTPNEANLHVVRELINNPRRSAEELLRAWATEKFGDKAAGAVAEALSRTFEAACKIFYLLGFWVSDHSEVPSLEYAWDHLIGYGIERAERVPETRELLMELLHPTEKTIQMAVDEKDQAIDICRESLRAIESARMDLAEPAYSQLRDCFELELNCSRIWRLLTEVLIRRQMYKNGQRSQRGIIRSLLIALVQLAHDTERKFTSSVRPGNPGAVRAFIRDIALDMDFVQFFQQ